MRKRVSVRDDGHSGLWRLFRKFAPSRVRADYGARHRARRLLDPAGIADAVRGVAGRTGSIGRLGQHRFAEPKHQRQPRRSDKLQHARPGAGAGRKIRRGAGRFQQGHQP